uniref:Uncharacterized protein n=1 Tax=Anguilla anguilla TaxID=7936 RepID=A0A0E9TCB4_ANGAN
MQNTFFLNHNAPLQSVHINRRRNSRSDLFLSVITFFSTMCPCQYGQWCGCVEMFNITVLV